MFAILIFERELTWKDLLPNVQTWVHDAGGFAALGLLVWCIVLVARKVGERTQPKPMGQGRLVLGLAISSFIMYLVYFSLLLPFVEGRKFQEITINEQQRLIWVLSPTQAMVLTIAAGLALIGVTIPVLTGLASCRCRRIWALARLSIIETVRQKTLWVFASLLLIVLFASWFIGSDKPEFQLRNYVWVVDGATTLILILAAGLLAAFSIPADVKSQTIHTVVTKPVQRFEIVIGRFLGYTGLMTVVLLVVTVLSLGYLFRELTPEAKEENYKARVPIYGSLRLENAGEQFEGESVGQELDHRRYIRGAERSGASQPNYAIWKFTDLPTELVQRSKGVACEFAFDVYRTWKGEKGDEGKGIFCSFLVVSSRCQIEKLPGGRWKLAKETDIVSRQNELKNKDPKVAKQILAEEFGFYEDQSLSVTNNHTQRIILPAALFTPLEEEVNPAGSESAEGEDEELAPLRIIVSVNDQSKGQRVGVNVHDLYLLDEEKPFELNFLKGAFGLWCRLCLVIGVAVACSTYLSGVISWLCTMFVFGLGLFKESIRHLALGVGGVKGPMVSLIEVTTGKQVQAPDPVMTVFDQAHANFLEVILKMIPDVNRFDLSRYVANGFDISVIRVLFLDNLLPLLAYLLPWFLLSYYLIQSREVANPT
jgi:hypothetical protein